MPALSPAPLLALVLLSGPAVAAPCQTGGAHVQLSAAPLPLAPRVCISPGNATVFSFDTALSHGSATLEGGERFAQVEEGRSMLKLVPSEKVLPGEELPLTVRFADGAAPSSAMFVLVAHVGQAASLVEVHRQQRPVESYQRELRAKEEEARQLREEIARLRAERSAPGGVAGLLASGIVGPEGLSSVKLTADVTQAPGDAVEVDEGRAYRASGRVVVALRLNNAGGAPWTVEGASLTPAGRRGQGLKVLTLWQEGPAVKGAAPPLLVVEAEAPSDDAPGPHTLTLWDAGGARRVTLQGVTWP